MQRLHPVVGVGDVAVELHAHLREDFAHSFTYFLSEIYSSYRI